MIYLLFVVNEEEIELLNKHEIEFDEKHITFEFNPIQGCVKLVTINHGLYPRLLLLNYFAVSCFWEINILRDEILIIDTTIKL